ncbi:uncharacterized protein LOC115090983 [Rhinatrema bivittatum]|uniref:uncharacterized protein LOC115090983 n=1 Tax=Rhinatrema bivittatum TaxID=194408 RepID=UPI00112CB856|nr:uncharacterized protein LOC115090983 [Rhinatrema bivittatum]
MATSTADLLFEGFLKKRKDKMKFAWAKYWFRLQNTTLFFYTEKSTDPSYLRGQYYIYKVQSVREMKATENEYTFEITMKNGKKKLLAAESAELRAVWIQFLWKSMQLPGPGREDSACTWHDIPSLLQTLQSGQSPTESQLDSRTPQEIRDCEPNTSVNSLSCETRQTGNFVRPENQSSSEEGDTSEDENEYDVPKPRSLIRRASESTEGQNESDEEESHYAIPRKYTTEVKTNTASGDAAGEKEADTIVSLSFEELHGMSTA